LTVGAGVVCGLTVIPTSNGQGVVVGAGVAIDGFGREIVVPVPSLPVDVRKLTDECGRPTGEGAAPGSTVTLCLAYQECQTDLVPSQATDCDGTPHSEASSVQERYRLVLKAGEPSKVQVGCSLPDSWQAIEQVDVSPDVTTGLRLNYPRVVERVSQPCPD